jgi:hypothetical protein
MHTTDDVGDNITVAASRAEHINDLPSGTHPIIRNAVKT